jgi:ABC-2 type transport system permease protein
MLNDLLKFEAYYHCRKPLFWITLISFLVIGFLFGSTSGITFPNVHKNAPYEITYLVGLLSLASIFSITLTVAQNILREAETKLDAIIYATPVSKGTYLFTRIISLAFVAFLSVSVAVAGLYLAHVLAWQPGEKIGPFDFMYYTWPLLVLALPNILLCTAVLCSMAWITGNKLMVYVSGLLIYILYITGSIFSNSPLIAGSAPASPEAMFLFARLDPFGMAAFFEQTRYWTAPERNSLNLALTGGFLFNRVLWLSVSVVVLAVSYKRFSFRTRASRRSDNRSELPPPQRSVQYRPAQTHVFSRRHYITSLFSFVRIDLASIVKGIPFILIMLLWTVLLAIELINAVQGDPRLGENHANTAIIITTIMEVLPFFTLLVILFYSNELIWRSRAVHFAGIEETAPQPPGISVLSKLVSLSVIPGFLILYSSLAGILMQLLKGFPVVEYSLYLSLFYFLGLPLLLMTVLIISLQVIIRNKYLGLATATAIILVTGTSIGRMIGVTHPLLRYANPLSIPYADLNGFGSYVTAFHWQMICWGAFSLAILILTSLLRHRSLLSSGTVQRTLLVVSFLVFVCSAGFIFYQTNIKDPDMSPDELNDWKQAYEQKFKQYESIPQPTIADVKTKVDLYPRRQRYEVEGKYELVNKTDRGIDSLLIYIDQQTTLKNMSIPGAQRVSNESAYGHYWYRLNRTLRPGEKITMDFRFSSEWSAFKGHQPFNSIIGNGSFLRISNYYPALGYNAENEISSKLEREKRAMPAQSPLPTLDTSTPLPFDYRFTGLDAIVSTDDDQTVIGVGDLIKKWTAKGRNYFHYKTPGPVPFRFAFSSARYECVTDRYQDIRIEVYYDKRHAGNVRQLISDAKKTLRYCEASFGEYPYKVIRFAEISAFAEGFGATSYPSTIYMKENGGFYARLTPENRHGVINELAGHELSHQWWGCAQTAPEYKEGGWILTETLAKYTELMLYQKAHGLPSVLEKVRQHTDLYLSARSFSQEPPLYKTTFETPHLPYDKGLVVMYQLRQLIGEQAINKALKSLLVKHKYPNPPADSRDLLRELYLVSHPRKHPRINELFKQVVIYNSKMESAAAVKTGVNSYQTSFSGSVIKFREDGNGKQNVLPPEPQIEVCLYTDDMEWEVRSFPVVKGRVRGTFQSAKKPVRIVIDPHLKTLDSFVADNEKTVDEIRGTG